VSIKKMKKLSPGSQNEDKSLQIVITQNCNI